MTFSSVYTLLYKRDTEPNAIYKSWLSSHVQTRNGWTEAMNSHLLNYIIPIWISSVSCLRQSKGLTSVRAISVRERAFSSVFLVHFVILIKFYDALEIFNRMMWKGINLILFTLVRSFADKSNIKLRKPFSMTTWSAIKIRNCNQTYTLENVEWIAMCLRSR